MRGLPWHRDERGSVAAELAVALPAVALTVLLGAGVLGAAARQVALQDAVADAARLLGRGEGQGAAAGVVGAAVPGAVISTRSADGLVCVEASVDGGVTGVARVPLRASSCALDGGR
ncbi:hypothetical protein [Streptomyces sp. AC495_CC817]|uniref:hypothetical protein n=1 Tax=Streptomyces sp. AC495_CC817 TaxID=2823900 RepID=UPI001C260F76|nr:hypothetical protein [Streptomyces sp. AC495_CC817]